MILSKLLSSSKFELLQGELNIDINNVRYDTRQVEKNDIFICIKGRNIDRHDLAAKAVENGATALLVEREIEGLEKNVTVVKVEDLRVEMARLSCILYDNPSKEFNLVGITGTNGKTSVSVLAKEMFGLMGDKIGIVGTVGCIIGSEEIELGQTTPTTPESPELQRAFSIMREEKVSTAIIEATSRALQINRVDFSDFDIGVFLNLSHDHLDDHGTMENYKNEKMKLFKMSKKSIVNNDDVVSEEIKKTFSGELISFGIKNDADIRATNLSFAIDSVEFDVEYKEVKKRVKSNIPGRFTVSNILAVLGIGIMIGYDFEELLKNIPQLKGVRGRLEVYRTAKEAVAIVDYAHSPDSLESLLDNLNEYAEGRIITVFGCGGDRDNTKRPLMGEIAGRLSNKVIVTSDNPRSEDPKSIVDEIETGMKDKEFDYVKIVDREEAIKTAMGISEKGDIVVVAGKGHETYQILKDKTIDFDDMKMVKKYDLK